jgi:hypothetical protein
MNLAKTFKKEVWPRVERDLKARGSQKYTGFTGREKEWGWQGPYIWSENGDLKRLIARRCERTFGCWSVHTESKIDQFMYESFKKSERWKSIDIDVTPVDRIEKFKKKKDAHKEFRKHTHGLFIEVKRIAKGQQYQKRYIEAFKKDCEKLHKQLTCKPQPRCEYAVAVLSDEHGYFRSKKAVCAFVKKLKNKYQGVNILVWSASSQSD